MRKKLLVSIAIFLCFSIISIISCSINYAIPDNYAPNCCAFFVCPLCTNPDMKGNPYSILEKDDYERLLFKKEIQFDSHSFTCYFILQKYDRKTIYFYENGFVLDSEELDLDSFKNANDWNLPFDEDKLSSRTPVISFDGVIQFDDELDMAKLKKEIETVYSIDDNDIISYCITDFKKNKALIWFTIECDSMKKELFVMVSDNLIVAIFETDSIFTDIDKISFFKLNNDW